MNEQTVPQFERTRCGYCLTCFQTIQNDDVIVLNGTGFHIALSRSQLAVLFRQDKDIFTMCGAADSRERNDNGRFRFRSLDAHINEHARTYDFPEPFDHGTKLNHPVRPVHAFGLGNDAGQRTALWNHRA